MHISENRPGALKRSRRVKPIKIWDVGDSQEAWDVRGTLDIRGHLGLLVLIMYCSENRFVILP